ncbi:MAG: DUF885 domain-containing protein [Gammaproteobacteria bacterium]|nr:DUF885 domain-containing protein [Gammaproteobacteria bacterium]MYE31057.1 DUF885 domain-containing protein [Gammaproteobacteria bacterium]
MSRIWIVLGLMVFGLAQAAESESESGELRFLVEEYFEASLELNPLQATFLGDRRYNDRLANYLGAEHRAASEALTREYLERIEAIDPERLGREDRLTFEIFRLNLENSLEIGEFPEHLLAINQFYSFANQFAQLGSGTSAHPFANEEDYRDFLSRIDGFVVLTDQTIANMRVGLDRNVTQPRVLMERVVGQLSALDRDLPESVFYGPIEDFPEDMSAAVREQLADDFAQAYDGKLRPAYRRLHDFIRDDYLPRARASVGMFELPGGEDWYATLVRHTTTTDLTPAEIHEIGLREVASIHEEMRQVMEEVEFEGELDAFFEYLRTEPSFYYDEPEQLIEGYRAMSDHVQSLAPRLFETFPRSEFEVRAVEAFREASAADGSYQAGTPDGSRPGIFFANTYDVGSRPKWEMESLFLHEAIPGHHYQISLQRELEDLPSIRRFGGNTAFVEGWALYTESLGRELGLYTDPYQYFGALNAELWRAIRLVVDTGLHSMGWTREDVLAYMFENSASGEASAVSEAERYIAIPSQALAYKIGELKIRELRTRAETALGEDFDVREFHTQVLMDGALPLSLLEAKIDAWIESK